MESEQGTARHLIERARRGDSAAQTALWHQHRRWVAAIVLAHRPRAVEVDDLMQEVAVILIDRLDTLRDPRAFRPWLRRIVINICRGAARSLRPTVSLMHRSGLDAIRQSGARQVDFLARECKEYDDVESNDEAQRVLDQALTLPREYREPLLLRCLQSMSYRQISETLEIPVTTVETRLTRARRMLREELGKEIGRNDTVR